MKCLNSVFHTRGRSVFFTSLIISSMVMLFLMTGCGSGSNGGKGPAGSQGPAGTNGTNGSNGAQGAQGPQGPQGPSGPAGTNGTSLHVVDANGNDMGILVDEYASFYNVYNTTANIFFSVIKTSGTVFSYLFYTSSNCTDSGTVYVYAGGYTTNDLIVDNAGNCFSITTTTPGNVGVSSSEQDADGQHLSCYSFGGVASESVYPATQITCPISTQYAAPVNVKIE